MAEVLYVEPVVRFCAVISTDDNLRRKAIAYLESQWGSVVVSRLGLPFQAGGFYTDSMGDGLTKDLVAFGAPVDGGAMPDWKLWTNDLEEELSAGVAGNGAAGNGVERPLNLDPGYITQAKLVLATTKDRDHRVYLRDGIFGEVTLNYMGKKWVHHRWSYPDYRTERVAEFATECREMLRKHLIAGSGFRTRL